MSVNWTIFENAVVPYFKSGLIAKNTDDAARYISDIYDISVKTAATSYGNLTLTTNKAALFLNLKAAFSLMFSAGSLNVSSSAYTLMATGFISYWLGGIMAPLPPHLPAILPAFPNACQVVFPGDVATLSKMLTTALSDFSFIKTPKMSATLLMLALKTHLLSITGLYFGLMPVGLSILPGPPTPWVGIF